jgi:hypothetical protein
MHMVGQTRPDSLICNAIGRNGLPAMFLTVPGEGQFEIGANEVVWWRAKSDTPIVYGGVTGFMASQGADVNVTLNDQVMHQSHHLVGKIRCG